jgi:hypothetical protein
MKIFPRICLGWLLATSGLPVIWAQPISNNPVGGAAAIAAIQQAPDPSAAVAAYANGFAVDGKDPKLYEAYVARMIDLGLPEMAYHQAETLTTLDCTNGLAWGVVAYVDARRGQMPEAISAIILAGQLASDNKFVEHTAGEIVAWHDLRADQSSLPVSAKDGVAKVRGLLEKNPTFAEAYRTAKTAYQNQASAAPGSPASSGPPTPGQAPPPQYQLSPTTEPSQQAPGAPQAVPAPLVPPGPQVYYSAEPIAPLGYADAALPPEYYSDYSTPYYGAGLDFYSGWGPGWVAPTPWCWWAPCGFWNGCSFSAFGSVCLFGEFNRFHGGDFNHFGHSDSFGPGEHAGGGFSSGRGSGSPLWHGDLRGRNSFFGTPTRPSSSALQWSRANFQNRTGRSAGGADTHWWNGGGQRSMASVNSPNAAMMLPSTLQQNWGPTAARPGVIQGATFARGVGGASPYSAVDARVTVPSTSPLGPSSSSAYGAYRTSPRIGAGPVGQSYRAPRYTASRPTASGATSWRSYRPAPVPASQPGRAQVYAMPHWSAPRVSSYGGYLRSPSASSGSHGGGWTRSAAPHSYGKGSFGGLRGGSSWSSFGGGHYGGSSFGRGSSIGGSSGGGFGGGSHSGGFSGGGFHGGGHR